MGRSKWLLVCFTFGLCTFAAGIGVGWVLPHLEKTREGTKFYRQLVEENGSDKPGMFGGALGDRLYKKFLLPVYVLSKAPMTMALADGNTHAMSCLAVVPVGDVNPDTQALLSEIEEYLRDLAGATGAGAVKHNDIVENGKKVGFRLAYSNGSVDARPEKDGTLMINVNEIVKR